MAMLGRSAKGVTRRYPAKGYIALERSEGTVERSVRLTMELLRRQGKEDIRSMHETHVNVLPGSPLEHSLRAATLAQRFQQGSDLVVAALVHDCGHLLKAQAKHESGPHVGGGKAEDSPNVVGSSWLRQLGFSGFVCRLVASMPEARRFLCREVPGYAGNLSAVAMEHVMKMGGPMGEAEAVAFRSRSTFTATVALRQCCDEASLPRAGTDAEASPRLSHFKGLLEDHLGEQLSNASWWEDLGEVGTYHEKR
eukprot:TRINITY_DN23741_c0_g1_i1.p1 TRINITY_DN23741_c0_g1~~TRINITY_DN23741_c0_g1_i1.p1  ORF type:complete len:283 (-),score=45.96 TRINITY_DN23741_c0_g1_i1:669-1424(-)